MANRLTLSDYVTAAIRAADKDHKVPACVKTALHAIGNHAGLAYVIDEASLKINPQDLTDFLTSLGLADPWLSRIHGEIMALEANDAVH